MAHPPMIMMEAGAVVVEVLHLNVYRPPPPSLCLTLPHSVRDDILPTYRSGRQILK